MESIHAELLNELDDMSRSLVYALRRATIKEAEQLIAAQEKLIKKLEKELAELKLLTNTTPYIRITCGKTERVVSDIVIAKGTPHIGCSYVNKGHDDLYDQGFRHEDLEAYDLIITTEPK